MVLSNIAVLRYYGKFRGGKGSLLLLIFSMKCKKYMYCYEKAFDLKGNIMLVKVVCKRNNIRKQEPLKDLFCLYFL